MNPLSPQTTHILQKYALWVWVTCAVIASLASAWGHMLIGLNNDHLTLLDQAQQLREGARPYIDYTDVSPPLIHLLYWFPLTLATATGIKLYSALNLFTLVTIALSLLTVQRLLHHGRQSLRVNCTVVSSLAFALVCTSFIHQLFADREHLMIVLTAPWMVLYSPLANPRNTPLFWRWLAAVIAAIGFALKPYFYIFYLAILVYDLRSRGLRDILRDGQHRIVWAFALIYAAIVCIFFRSYLTVMLPLGWHTYGVISSPLSDKLGLIAHDLLAGYGLTGLLSALLLWLTAPAFFTRDIGYLLLLLAACVGSVFLNGGWEYTQYPFMVIALLLAVAASARLIEACRLLSGPGRQAAGVIAVTLLFLASVCHYYIYPAAWRAYADIAMQSVRGRPIGVHEMVAPAEAKANIHLAKRPRFMLLSTNLWNVDLLKDGTARKHIGRFDYLWPLPALLHMQADPARQAAYARWSAYLSESVASDIAHGKPDMIIVDKSPVQRSLPPFYPLLDWFARNPHFAEAWSAYRLADTINECNPRDQTDCAYDIYYRQ